MSTPNKALMGQAREALKGKWRLGIEIAFIYWVILAAVQFIPYVGWVASLLISGPLALGVSIYWLAFAKKEYLPMNTLFKGFNKFGDSFILYLLMSIYIFLWTLLLIIPGIVASLRYSQAFFIFAEDSNIEPSEALRRSKKIMYGHKWKLFRLWLRLFGWALLCILTLGIGFLWLAPYANVTLAKFYEDIKRESGEKEIPEVIEVPKA
jgi:uncharacterized membrane protein